MKTYFYIVLGIVATFAQQAFAEDAKTNEWGVVVCDVQMGIELKEPNKEIKPKMPVNLAIRIKSISTNEMHYFVIFSQPTDFSWIVTTPSGKDLLFKESHPMDSFSTMMVRLDQIQNWEQDFNLSLVCDFNEVGTYKVIAKKEILSSGGQKKCEVISNPLNIVVAN